VPPITCQGCFCGREVPSTSRLPSCFLDHFEQVKPTQSRTPKERERRDAVMNTYGNCCETPIWNLMESLNHTYGSSNVEFRRMGVGEYITTGSKNTSPTGKVSLKFYLLDCILDRRICLPITHSDDTKNRKSKRSEIRPHLLHGESK
jgi:hypothetical protein